MTTPTFPAGSGLLTVGTHVFAYTRLDGGGETIPSSASAAITVLSPSNAMASVVLPAFITGQTGANLYMSKAGTTTPLYLVNPIPITAAGAYLANVADAGLGAAAPGSNTTSTPLANPSTGPTATLTDAVDGIGWPVVASPEYSTDIFTAQSGKEVRTSNWPSPRYHFTIPLNFARNITGFRQFMTLWNFYASQKGAMIPFNYTSPADGITYLCRFEDDTLDFEEFMANVWEVKTIKLVSLL